MTSTTEHINQILIEENQIPTEENQQILQTDENQLTLQIASNFTSTKNIDLGEKSNNKNEDQKEIKIKINTNPDQIQEQTKTKTKTTTTTTTNKKIEDGENLSKNKTNKNQIKKTTTNTTPKTTKKKIFPKNEKKNQKTKPRTLYTTEKPKRSSLNTNKTKKLKLKSINKKGSLAEKTNCTNTGNGHEGTLVKTQKKSLNNHRRKTPRLLYSTQNPPKKKLSPKRSHPNFSTIKTKNYTRLHSSKIPPKKTFYNKKYVKTLPSKNKHTNNKSNDNNKEKERENQKHQQKQQTSKIAKKRYAQNHLKKKSARKKKFKKKVNRKNSIGEDLEIDPNFETRLKTPIRERILKRKMGLSKLDKKTEKRVLRHREKTLEENFSDFPELEKERILKIKELKTPDLNRIKMEQFKKFLSQFDIDFLKQNQKEIEREINKERGLLEQGSKEKTRNTNTKRNRSTNRDQNKPRRKIYNADPKKVRNKLRRFQEITDQHNKAATNKTKKIGYTKNHHRRNVITKKNRQQRQNQNGNRIGKHNANVRQKSKIKLITKSDMPKIPNVQGEMRYNSKTHEWEGNEQELGAFDMKGPTLISNINSTMTFTEFNGMKFNAKEHKWEGNEEEIDWGNSSEDEDFLNSANSTEPDPKNMHKNNDLATNSRYKIKNTFLLDDKTRNKFKNLEKSNKSLMRNWSVDESLFDSKFSIRSFSLSYIVEKSKFL